MVRLLSWLCTCVLHDFDLWLLFVLYVVVCIGVHLILSILGFKLYIIIVATSWLQRSCCHKVGGCSAGGLTVILHLDYIRSLLPHSVPWCQGAVLQPKLVTECWSILESWQRHMTVSSGSIINCWFHTIFPWTWRIHSNVTGVSSFVAPSAPPPQVRVAGLPQCGMFMDQPNYKGQPLYSPRYASIFKLMGALVSLLDIPTSHGDVCKSETNWIYFPYNPGIPY